LCTTHGVSNTFIDQFFSLLKVDLLWRIIPFQRLFTKLRE
jgi:hypothetical protein